MTTPPNEKRIALSDGKGNGCPAPTVPPLAHACALRLARVAESPRFARRI